MDQRPHQCGAGDYSVRAARRVGDRASDGFGDHGGVLPPAAGWRPLLRPRSGAWYAGRSIDTALAESIYHRSRELAEVGAFESRMQMHMYLSDFSTRFHDIRGASAPVEIYDSLDYTISQRFARQLLADGSHGVVLSQCPPSRRRVCRFFPAGAREERARRRPLRIPMGRQPAAVGAQAVGKKRKGKGGFSLLPCDRQRMLP